MKLFDYLLKVLEIEGYPNPKLDSIMKALSYDGEWFLVDLTNKFGIRDAEEFVRKALGKLSEQGKNHYIIKIPLTHYPNSWVELEIYDFYIDDEESETDIIVNYGWGNSRIVHPEDGSVTTLENIADDADMGEMDDYTMLIDDIRTDAYNYISQRCGFGIWYQ